MGPLALQLEIAYRQGVARGERSQLSALAVQKADFFATFGDAIHNLILEHRIRLGERIHAAAHARGNSVPPRDTATTAAFQLWRSEAEPKQRWVDQTPEYALHIFPLLQLFPEARFVHVVRDVTAVVRSMIHFERTGGPAVVASPSEGYAYWLRRVQACWRAEQAFGSDVVRRFFHADLVARPEQTLRAILEFLDEPFDSRCLEPMSRERINSSNVASAEVPFDLAPDPGLVAQSHRLSAEVMQAPINSPPDPAIVAELQEAFDQQVADVAYLPIANQVKAERIAELETQWEDHLALYHSST